MINIAVLMGFKINNSIIGPNRAMDSHIDISQNIKKMIPVNILKVILIRNPLFFLVFNKVSK